MFAAAPEAILRGATLQTVIIRKATNCSLFIYIRFHKICIRLPNNELREQHLRLASAPEGGFIKGEEEINILLLHQNIREAKALNRVPRGPDKGRRATGGGRALARWTFSQHAADGVSSRRRPAG